MPLDDISQDVECQIQVKDDKVKFTATRFLDTGDMDSDYLIPVDEEFFVAFAVNRETSNLMRIHDYSLNLYEWVYAIVHSDGAPTWQIAMPDFDGSPTIDIELPEFDPTNPIGSGATMLPTFAASIYALTFALF